MRAAPAAALLLLAACAPEGPDCAGDPSAPPGTAFEVVVSSSPTVVRRDLGFAGISALRASGQAPGGKLQGLTVAEHRLAYKSSIALSRGFMRKRSCAWLESLAVDLSPESVVIYVPKEYAPGSCAGEEILKHESRHEEIHRDTLAEYAEKLRAALAGADWLPGRARPLPVADRAEGERRIEAMVDKVVNPVYEEFKAELDKRQAVIDLPENYRWTGQRCDDWK